MSIKIRSHYYLGIKIMKKIISFGAILGSMPFVALAADAFTLVQTTQLLLNYVIPLLITIAVVYFIWGVIQYTLSSDEEKKKTARGNIITGLIGLFVIIAFWGIIGLITNTFNVGSKPLLKSDIPCVPGPGIIC